MSLILGRMQQLGLFKEEKSINERYGLTDEQAIDILDEKFIECGLIVKEDFKDFLRQAIKDELNKISIITEAYFIRMAKENEGKPIITEALRQKYLSSIGSSIQIPE